MVTFFVLGIVLLMILVGGIGDGVGILENDPAEQAIADTRRGPTRSSSTADGLFDDDDDTEAEDAIELAVTTGLALSSLVGLFAARSVEGRRWLRVTKALLPLSGGPVRRLDVPGGIKRWTKDSSRGHISSPKREAKSAFSASDSACASGPLVSISTVAPRWAASISSPMMLSPDAL